MTLREFKDVLLTVGVPVDRYASDGRTGTHILWGEYDEKGYYAGNVRVAQVQLVQVDLYTGKEVDPALGRLETALSSAGVAYSGPSTTYDVDTKRIRHVFSCEVLTHGQA